MKIGAERSTMEYSWNRIPERGLRVRRREGMGDRCQIACRESKHVFLFVAMMHMPFAGAIIASAFESFTINLFLNLPSFFDPN